MDAGCRVIHCDVMDGHFVPPITFGPMVVSALRESLPDEAYLDVHLMIERPERHVDEFAKAGADGITIHVESTPNIAFTLSAIRDLGLQRRARRLARARRPTHFGENEIDLALIMTVNPGWGGQPFLHQPARQGQARARDGRRRHADRGRRRRQPARRRRSAPRPARRGSSRARRSSAPTIRRPRTARSRPRRAADEPPRAFQLVSGPCARFAQRFCWPPACCSGPAPRPRTPGPASRFYPKAPRSLVLSGGQIAAIANLPARTYTLPPDAARARQEGDAARAVDRRPARAAGHQRAARPGRQARTAAPTSSRRRTSARRSSPTTARRRTSSAPRAAC